MGREDESLRIKGIAKLVVPIARTLVIVAAVTNGNSKKTNTGNNGNKDKTVEVFIESPVIEIMESKRSQKDKKRTELYLSQEKEDRKTIEDRWQ